MKNEFLETGDGSWMVVGGRIVAAVYERMGNAFADSVQRKTGGRGEGDMLMVRIRIVGFE